MCNRRNEHEEEIPRARKGTEVMAVCNGTLSYVLYVLSVGWARQDAEGEAGVVGLLRVAGMAKTKGNAKTGLVIALHLGQSRSYFRERSADCPSVVFSPRSTFDESIVLPNHTTTTIVQ